MRLIRSAPGSRPDNIMSRYKIKIFLEIRGWASTIWLDKCGVQQPTPSHFAIIEINTIFSIIYIFESRARICLELFWSKRVDFSFFFFLLIRHYKRGRENGIGIMASPLTSWNLSYNFHIRREKYLSKRLKFNAPRPINSFSTINSQVASDAIFISRA